MSNPTFAQYWSPIQSKLQVFYAESNLPLILKRNKGYLLRKFFGRVSDIFEFLFLALLADPKYLKSIISVYLIILSFNIFSEWLYISSKEIAADKKKHSQTFSKYYLIIVNLIMMGAFLYKGQGQPILILSLFAAKFGIQILQNYFLFKTLDIQTQKRVYIPLWKTLGPQLLAQGVAWILFLVTSNTHLLFPVSLALFSLGTIASELNFYQNMKQSMTTFKKWQSPLKQFKVISGIESLAFIAQRNFYILDLIALGFFLATQTESNFFFILFGLITLFRMVARPYRSLLIDFQTISRKTPYGRHLDQYSVLTSLGILLSAGLIPWPGLSIQERIFSLLIFMKIVLFLHSKEKSATVSSLLSSVFAWGSLYFLKSFYLPMLILNVDIIFQIFLGKAFKKENASSFYLIPIDKIVGSKKLSLSQSNFKLKHSKAEIKKLIPNKYIILQTENDNAYQDALAHLSYFIDYEKEIRLIHTQASFASLPTLNGANFHLSDSQGKCLKQSGAWETEELRFISTRSRFLDRGICQIGRAALFKLNDKYYYLIKNGSQELLAVRASSFTDSELEQLDEIKLKSLL